MPRQRSRVNVPASVRQRLLNLARELGEDFQLVLSDYAVERLLYRLSVSAYAERFVLKGAQLLRLWLPEQHRATWDLDLLGEKDNTVESVVSVVKELCAGAGEDGIVFDQESVFGEAIKTSEEHLGARVKLTAELAGARIPVQVDVGFGDAIVPPPKRASYPTLLGSPAPRLLVYPREAVVAEKLEAIIALGMTTSRMKDFYDLHSLAASFEFDGATLTEAIATTFGRRGTPIPTEEPVALSQAFISSPDRVIQWRAFLRRSRLEGAPESLEDLVILSRSFLHPLLSALRDQKAFGATWKPGGPWRGA